MAYQIRKVQQYKLDAVSRLKERFGNSKDYIFTNFRGLTVDQITELRRKLGEQEADYRVVKNRFAKIAFKDLNFNELDEYLVGPTAVALSRNDATSVAKVLFDFGKEAPLEVKGGIIEGQVFTAEDVEAFSKLPSREELLAKLMGTMNAPLQNLLYALNAVPQKLVRTLQAVADQKEKSGQ